MKRILLFLLLCLPILGYGQALSDQINTTIRSKNYDPNRAGDMYQAIADRVEAITVSGTNTYTATINSLTSYNSLQTLQLKFINANTGASTLQILPNLTVKPLKKISGGVPVDLASGDLTIGVHTIWYDGTNLIVDLGGNGGGGTSSLNAGHLFVGNGSNIATDVPLTGDASMSSAGAITVTKINGVTVPAGLYGSQSANQVWASPSGSSGAATFRGLTNADLSGTNAALYDANSNLTIHNSLEGYTTIPTAGSSSALFVSSPRQIYFTGTTTQTCLLPVASTLVLGFELEITNLSTGVVTVQSSGGNTIQALASRSSITVTCILTSGTGTASWSASYNPSIDGSFGGSGTVTSVTPANANLTITNTTTTPVITVVSAPKLTTGHTISATGDITWTSPTFDGSSDITSSSIVTKINGTSLSGLGTGILKNTTGTGIPSIAIAADFPTLNQNTTGTAAALTTGRTISVTGDLTYTSSSFDGSGNATGAGTLATVNSSTGSFGSSTAIPSFTVNGKGLITLASANAVVAPASTLSGTTLNSSIVNSSLTSVGTIISGVWNGTAITNTNLANSSISIAGNSTSLGGSVTQDNITGLSSTGLIKRTGANTLAIATSGVDYAPANLTINNQTTDYTLVLADAGVSIRMNAATNKNITVPTHASVAFPVMTSIELEPIGLGTVTVVAAGGVIVTPTNIDLVSKGRYQPMYLVQISNDNWELRNGLNTNGQALTKTDDTNVTLTLAGSPTTALNAATSMALGWTGRLAFARLTQLPAYSIAVNNTNATGDLTSVTGTNTTLYWDGSSVLTNGVLPFAAGGTGQTFANGVTVTTQFDKTSSTALANVTGLSFTVVAGKTYIFESTLFTTSNVAGGVQFAIAGTATATSIRYEGDVEDALTNAAQSRATALGTAVGAVTAVTNATCKISGSIVVNAGGTLTVQFAQNASNGTASSVLTGSYFRCWQIN